MTSALRFTSASLLKNSKGLYIANLNVRKSCMPLEMHAVALSHIYKCMAPPDFHLTSDL